MISSELLYGIACLTIVSYPRKERGMDGLAQLHDKLRMHYTASLSSPGRMEWWKNETSSEEYLQSLIKEAYFKAQPLHTALFNLAGVLSFAYDGYQANKRLYNILRLRITLTLGFSLLARVLTKSFYLNSSIPSSLRTIDSLLLLLSCLLVAASLWIITLIAPTHWAWANGFTEQGKNWLRYSMLEESYGEDALGAPLRDLYKEQMANGIYLGKERERYIAMYQVELDNRHQRVFKNILEAMPVFDLIAVGIPAFLMLAIPAYQVVVRLGWFTSGT